MLKFTSKMLAAALAGYTFFVLPGFGQRVIDKSRDGTALKSQVRPDSPAIGTDSRSSTSDNSAGESITAGAKEALAIEERIRQLENDSNEVRHRIEREKVFLDSITQQRKSLEIMLSDIISIDNTCKEIERALRIETDRDNRSPAKNSYGAIVERLSNDLAFCKMNADLQRQVLQAKLNELKKTSENVKDVTASLEYSKATSALLADQLKAMHQLKLMMQTTPAAQK